MTMLVQRRTRPFDRLVIFWGGMHRMACSTHLLPHGCYIWSTYTPGPVQMYTTKEPVFYYSQRRHAQTQPTSPATPSRHRRSMDEYRRGQQAFARMANLSITRPVAIAHRAQQLKPGLAKPPALLAGPSPS